MANSVTLFSIIFSCFLLRQLVCTNSQNVIKGGYWFKNSGLALNNIDSTLFTHLFCAFADLNPQSNQLIISPENQDSFSQFTSTVQRKNPPVKTFLSIAGGSANKTAYGIMARQPNSRKSFIDSSIRLARQLGFHGLDLDWESPLSATDMTNIGTIDKHIFFKRIIYIYIHHEIQSVRNKVNYVKDRGLLGYFAWHVAGDQNWVLSRTG
uniref:Acidic mammalian chitinase-like n=1 Tax=Nicotiana tabacum TaxID=4097 RepID=A0A1S4A391_TOBAC|nr:PREDICTED: acidic mammalian chitinase-like [Nicotiana tabacum]